MLPNIDRANSSVPRVCVSTGAASVFSTHFRNHTSVLMSVGGLIKGVKGNSPTDAASNMTIDFVKTNAHTFYMSEVFLIPLNLITSIRNTYKKPI